MAKAQVGCIHHGNSGMNPDAFVSEFLAGTKKDSEGKHLELRTFAFAEGPCVLLFSEKPEGK